ncbi:glycoside hydrolase family 30 protein [Gelidibacter japonicus]|jgi:glucosylceramidase|uniref:glycoside hydrolase family 30 protein n=1 Tax=Gelidibacter japonicus TaxID=1962232 RepID=UPI002AFF1125|nr:glycoside hydrolase family 30 beta sandwich domain-containing protein [Gelidibacter japonicus]
MPFKPWSIDLKISTPIHMSIKLFILTFFTMVLANCSSNSENNSTDDDGTPPLAITNDVDFRLTKADQSVLLQKQSTILGFGTSYNNYPTIEINESQTYQMIDGFGFTLTGGSAEVINQLSSSKKQQLLLDLFGSDENSIGISYLRLSIGASDMNATTFSYDDMPVGETDVNLDNFNLGPDLDSVIPLLKEILAINPSIKIMGSPWSAPVWMKDNESTVGGKLQVQYYDVYANYFVKYIQAMANLGITIDAITPQNEPLHDGNNPSMLMTAEEQANFIKNSLGPAFQMANIATKIIIYDHNSDNYQYPLSILNDVEANKYIAGSAFHLYAGDISALSNVHTAFPNKDIYFTEQYTSSNGDFGGDLKWHLNNVIIGSMRHWSKTALEWNLANNINFGPHTDGGCTTCKGAITVTSATTFTKNVGYYIIGHASKFVPQGSIRIGSNLSGNLNNVAFKTPQGKKVLIVVNDGGTNQQFNIKYNNKWIITALNAGDVGTYVWE